MIYMRKIIGIHGLIGSGKDTIADYLVDNYNFTKLKFADKLKDVVSVMFSLDREMLEGSTKESREEREEPLPFWTKELGKEISPRYILQVFGTECMRKGFYDDIWVSFVKEEILKNPEKNYVLPDTRFGNEAKMIKDLGGSIWFIQRGDLPDWWEAATNWNQAHWNHPRAALRMKNPFVGAWDIHASERSLAGYKFDHTIYNDSSLDALYDAVKQGVNNVVTNTKIG
jgi:hypothetical protein